MTESPFRCAPPSRGRGRDGVVLQAIRPARPVSPESRAMMSGSEYVFFAQHFGLTERPFTLLPDPDFLYWSPAHKRAFSVLEYGVMTRAPITVITGEVGAGKTTLLQKLLTVFDETTKVGLISNATGNRGELLQWVLNALDVPCDMDAAYVTKFQVLQDWVIEQYSQNNHVVLIIDEAQNLSIEGLEELRMLTNINSNKDELLQLILMGQPELREMITRHELQAVRAARHGKLPHSRHGPREHARLCAPPAAACRRFGRRIHRRAVDRIQKSGGVPRLVNKLADFAMVYAVTSDKRRRRGRHRRGAGRRHLSRDVRIRPRRPPNEERHQVLLAADPAPPALMLAIIILFTALGLVQADAACRRLRDRGAASGGIAADFRRPRRCDRDHLGRRRDHHHPRAAADARKPAGHRQRVRRVRGLRAEMTPDRIVVRMQADDHHRAAGRPQPGHRHHRRLRGASGQIAADVVNEYVTRIIAANVELRTGAPKARSTSSNRRCSGCPTELAKRSARISQFQAENADALPADQTFRLSRQAVLQERIASASANCPR
jgi:general secretion pathway protein A